MRLNPDLWPAIGLGITQTIGYGALYYAYGILLPYMADDLGLSISQGFSILSLALFFGGLLAPLAGRLTDRYGGRWVMTIGSFMAGLALISLSKAQGSYSLFAAIFFAETAGIFVLYAVAFASIARIDISVPAQKSITIITLFGGVASTIFWPGVLASYRAVGWEQTWVLLGILTLVVCVPIHFLALRGPLKNPEIKDKNIDESWRELEGRDRRIGMVWMTICFVLTSYAMAGVMVMWVVNAEDMGHSAVLAATAGAIIGPFKTIGRFFQMLISTRMHPWMTKLLSLTLMLSGMGVVLTFGFSLPGIMLAAALYGMGDGINTIANGTLPLSLFGAKGYGERLGWINSIRMAFNASAPFVFALVTQSFGGWYSFGLMLLFLVAAIAAFFFIPSQGIVRES